MRGDDRVLDYLNRSLRSELTSINQYWLHYRIFDNWGFKELAKKWREESIEEMRHADRFVTRILFLEGFPNLQVLDPLRMDKRWRKYPLRPCRRNRRARLYTEAAEYCISVHDVFPRSSMTTFSSTRSITSTFWKRS